MNDRNTLPTVGEKGEIVLYQPDESIRLEVRFEDETVWLTQAQMAELFAKDVSVISRHISRILKDGELDEKSNLQKMQIPNSDKPITFYSLDMIISVGYRVNSRQGVMFRRWATQVLKQFMLRGYSVNQHLVALQERMDSRLVAIESELTEQRQKVEFLIRREQPVTEQLFSTGCVWDAYTFVSDLVRTAADRIILIDPFVDERTLLLLDKRADAIPCTVHTRYSQQTELDFHKHNQQCAPIGKVQLPQAVHDRYLIIDNQVWLLGASVKDMGRGLTTVIKLSFTPDEILSRV